MFRDKISHHYLAKVDDGSKTKLQLLVENTADDVNFVLPRGLGFVRDTQTLPPGYTSFKELGESFILRLFMR